MLQDKLENGIWIEVRLRLPRSEPTLIVMHPKTWDDLVKEVTEKRGMAINIHNPNLEYRGIKVFRSLDLKEGEFVF